MTGKEDELIKGLSKLCSQQTGLTFAAKMYLNGQYEGNTILYEENKYPFNCIGPVRFLWKYKSNDCDKNELRNLWIWSHPSIYQQVENQLKNVFDLNDEKDVDDENTAPAVKKRKLQNDKNKICLKSLKDKLVRFKLLGPLSTTILGNVLKTVDLMDEYDQSL